MTLQKENQMTEIASLFRLKGHIVSCGEFGDGHINETFRVVCREGEKERVYILQRVNVNVFHDFVGLMENVQAVCAYLRKKIREEGGNPHRECLELVSTRDGKNYVEHERGCFRVYRFIEGTRAYQKVESPYMFYSAGVAFGNFARLLEEFPAKTLHEILPDFHNTRKRYEAFCRAVETDRMNRAGTCLPEIAFVRERAGLTGSIVDLLEQGKIPLRVTHNDTKLNNVLIEEATGEAICVVDFDTIMPGSILYDFGDAIRSGCNTSYEDEKDLSKVHFSEELFSEYVRGYMRGMQGTITPCEREHLVLGAVLITLECGMRFLTDYLDGDRYFKTDYPEHNLVRARTQFRLVDEMQCAEARLQEIVRSCE